MTRAGRLAVLVLTVVPACGFGLGNCTTQQLVNVTDFEDDDCVGTCGIRVEQGAADVTTALHPGEHALHIAPGSRVATPWFAVMRPAQDSFSLIARCTGGGTLHVTERERPRCDAHPEEHPTSVALDVTSDRWLDYAAVASDPVPSPRDAGAGQPAVDVRVVIESGPTGDCFIDELALRTDPGVTVWFWSAPACPDAGTDAGRDAR